MQAARNRRKSRLAILMVLTSAAAIVAGCASDNSKSMVRTKRSKEYFSESAYGVKASPRVTNRKGPLPRGGGRDQTGKPYMVKGKWYYPKEDRNYKAAGKASWYGAAFHGRLTANGEVYDMAHLTAAHPTMPLPSYARVTNVANGSSVIVRVNDRGPYERGRVIDLSAKAAQMLGYANNGTADVKVEYVGRAPLDGRDDSFLMASYKPGRGNGMPDPSDGLPTGVMIAMNGPTPTARAARPATAFPGALSDAPVVAQIAAAQPTVADVVTAAALPDAVPVPADPASTPFATVLVASAGADLQLPDLGPIVPDRPAIGIAANHHAGAETGKLSYADERIDEAVGALAALSSGTMTSGDVVSSWKRLERPEPIAAETAYIAVGTYASRAEAEAQAEKLSRAGRIEIVSETVDGTKWHVLNLYEDGRADFDGMLEMAWRSGAEDAVPVRN